MSQRLIVPFQKSILECGYKVKKYKEYWGFDHYGIDLTVTDGVPNPASYDHTIRASGNGKVVWCKYDSVTGNAKSLGWALAISYPDCVGRDGSVKTLIARYMHAGTVFVRAGQEVQAGQEIAVEGKCGTSVEHLHFELDTDTAYPQYSPQVSDGHTGWKKGYRDSRDSTLNPSLWLWQDAGNFLMPYPFQNKEWITAGIDDNIPFIPVNTVDYEALYKEYYKKYNDLKNKLHEILEKY